MRRRINKFPYHGTFTRVEDGSNPNSFGNKKTVLDADINIRMVSNNYSETIKEYKYKILYNMIDGPNGYTQPLMDGDIFEATINNAKITGEVKGIYSSSTSRLSKCYVINNKTN